MTVRFRQLTKLDRQDWDAHLFPLRATCKYARARAERRASGMGDLYSVYVRTDPPIAGWPRDSREQEGFLRQKRGALLTGNPPQLHHWRKGDGLEARGPGVRPNNSENLQLRKAIVVDHKKWFHEQ